MSKHDWISMIIKRTEPEIKFIYPLLKKNFAMMSLLLFVYPSILCHFGIKTRSTFNQNVCWGQIVRNSPINSYYQFSFFWLVNKYPGVRVLGCRSQYCREVIKDDRSTRSISTGILAGALKIGKEMATCPARFLSEQRQNALNGKSERMKS